METAPTPQQSLSLDTVAKVTGLTAFFTYASGFLIVTLHESSFGFIEVNPLKPRVLTAGAYFIAALAIPIFMANVMIRSDGIDEPKVRRALVLVSVLFYYVACQVVGIFLLLLLSGKEEYGDLLVWAILLTALGVGARRLVARVPPGLLIVTSIVGIIFLLIRSVILIHRHRVDGGIELWFFLVGLEGRWNIAQLKKPEEIRKLPLIVLLLLPALWLFAQEFYPRISSSWAGGGLTPVMLYFSKDSKLMPSGEIQTQLIEQSDAGLYVLIQDDKKAVFIPRASIALMQFSDQRLPPALLSTDPAKPSGASQGPPAPQGGSSHVKSPKSVL